MRYLVHMILHFVVPGLVARWFFRPQWKKMWVIFIATMVVDLDHFWATPVFNPDRCSIGFHPLHTGPAIGLYVILSLLPGTRAVGIGLLIHMALDALDCLMMG